MLAAGVGCFLLAYAGFAATGASLAILAACFVAAGVAIGCVETAEHAAVASLAPADLRGSAFGLLAAVQSFGNLVASAVAGILWTAISPAAGLLFAASLSSSSIVASRRSRPTPPMTATATLRGAGRQRPRRSQSPMIATLKRWRLRAPGQRRVRRLREVGDEPSQLGARRRLVGELRALGDLVEGQAAVAPSRSVATAHSRSASDARSAGFDSSGGPAPGTATQSS